LLASSSFGSFFFLLLRVVFWLSSSTGIGDLIKLNRASGSNNRALAAACLKVGTGIGDNQLLLYSLWLSSTGTEDTRGPANCT
jgi:hypothetical protein